MESFPKNNSESLKGRFKELTGEYTGNLDLRLAAEYMLDVKFESHLNNDENKPLSIAGDYLLVETSYLIRRLIFMRQSRR
jgi:hypothetical protein